MNGLPRHPGTDELAEFLCGMSNGARGDQLAAHIAECPECTCATGQLEYIPAVLAAIPQPALPADIASRIMTALAAEAAVRNGMAEPGVPALMSASLPFTISPGDTSPATAGSTAAASVAAASVTASVAADSVATARARRDWRSQRLTAPLGALVAAAACLILAFIGLHLNGQAHSGAAAAAPSGAPARSGGVAAGPRQTSLSPAFGPAVSFPFLVTTTNFRSSTLQAQVIQQLALLGLARGAQAGSATGQASPGGPSGGSSGLSSGGPSGHASPAAGAGPAAGIRLSPSRALIGCVSRLAGSTRPTLVEEASYQSRPAYMIATSTHVWVVARDCDSSNTALFASIALSPSR